MVTDRDRLGTGYRMRGSRMTTQKMIGIGVAGSGLGVEILRVHHDPDSPMEVRGICEPDPRRRYQRYEVGKTVDQIAEEFGVGLVAETYEQLLGRPGIDVICVYSPCPCHFGQIRAAVLAGKHLIVTKPMVVSMDEAREVVRLVERAGITLLVAQSMRWNPMFREIHHISAAGELGDIRLAEAYHVHDFRSDCDVSPCRYEMPQYLLYGGVCHPIDLLHWSLGEVGEVFAYGSHGGLDRRYPRDKANNFVISLKSASGAIARVLGAFDVVHPPTLWSRPFHGVGLGLYGTKASLINDRLVRDAHGAMGSPRKQPWFHRRAASGTVSRPPVSYVTWRTACSTARGPCWTSGTVRRWSLCAAHVGNPPAAGQQSRSAASSVG